MFEKCPENTKFQTLFFVFLKIIVYNVTFYSSLVWVSYLLMY